MTVNAWVLFRTVPLAAVYVAAMSTSPERSMSCCSIENVALCTAGSVSPELPLSSIMVTHI